MYEAGMLTQYTNSDFEVSINFQSFKVLELCGIDNAATLLILILLIQVDVKRGLKLFGKDEDTAVET